jgi:hypothetical protein
MIIATHQPIFSPWLGFFFKALHCDLLVLLDDVQFPRGTTWTSRNRFKFHQGDGTLWLTVPVWKKGRGLQKINEVEICYEEDWPRKHLSSLSAAYAHAPYWEDHRPFWEETYLRKSPKLIDLNLQIIEYLKTSLAISTRVQLSSSLIDDDEALPSRAGGAATSRAGGAATSRADGAAPFKADDGATTSSAIEAIEAKGATEAKCATAAIEATGNERLIEICRRLNASIYLAQYEARNFIQEEAFSKAGIQVRYFRFHHPIYPQLWGDFIYNLSAWDLLINCGPRSYNILAGSPFKMILPEELSKEASKGPSDKEPSGKELSDKELSDHS